ncbi:hypothetical protein BMF94_3841 [Rhodotorula taiwanensis]|uniref:Uncharacterized protein n=1 Tax=Rhodotorula taiwanensis TaxID=741276 RepID=A0A2S5B8P5_9BASI|nr:hypothetical protein BMF94_3841 [Rhodotorula taiwanensis]
MTLLPLRPTCRLCGTPTSIRSYAMGAAKPSKNDLLSRHPAFQQAVEPRKPTTTPKKPRRPWAATPHRPVQVPKPAPGSMYREPPLVERARQKTVGQRSVWESYLVLPWNVRFGLWLGIGAFATIGLYAGDYLFPPEEGELEQAVQVENARLAESAGRPGAASG